MPIKLDHNFLFNFIKLDHDLIGHFFFQGLALITRRDKAMQVASHLIGRGAGSDRVSGLRSEAKRAFQSRSKSTDAFAGSTKPRPKRPNPTPTRPNPFPFPTSLSPPPPSAAANQPGSHGAGRSPLLHGGRPPCDHPRGARLLHRQIGGASCRERVFAVV